ncbi:hypothetical protein [Arachidicoccus ginsenosidivorans]|uniref:hypothetical protein n=1 Tax=Arachidicoccus ginsenosidivorans TaxID=496057 RepID=UPI0013153487|nr:hypothetical protein [Arachidicoccus ginsenosidivorans]
MKETEVYAGLRFPKPKFKSITYPGILGFYTVVKGGILTDGLIQAAIKPGETEFTRM